MNSHCVECVVGGIQHVICKNNNLKPCCMNINQNKEKSEIKVLYDFKTQASHLSGNY